MKSRSAAVRDGEPVQALKRARNKANGEQVKDARQQHNPG